MLGIDATIKRSSAGTLGSAVLTAGRRQALPGCVVSTVGAANYTKLGRRSAW